MKMTKVAGAVVVLSAFGLSAAAQSQGDDAGALRGDWSVVDVKDGTKSAPADLVKDITAHFDGQTYTNRKAYEVVEQGVYAVDASKTPRAIDFSIQKGPDAGKRQLGIFQVMGDTLTLCLTDPGSPTRPTTLEPKAGSGVMTYVMKRAKP